jgi:uncharacterized protein YbcI
MALQPAPQQEPLGGGRLGAAISNAVVAIARDYLGRGPTKARTTVERDMVVVVLQDTLTKAERSLVEAGCQEAVLQSRQLLQSAMRGALVDAVEELAGRRVQAFMSANHIDPDVACEVFLLEPDSSETGAS